MNRRQLIKQVAWLTGATVVGGDFFLAGCKSTNDKVIGSFSEADIGFFDEVAETILPRTDKPGAKDAGVGKFMAFYSSECYTAAHLDALRNGIDALNAESVKKYDDRFVNLRAEDKQELLTAVDAQARKYNQDPGNAGDGERVPHYYTLMKQMVLLGFFTSKPGVTQVLRWEPVPGKYQGCIELKPGDSSWA